MSVCFVSGLWDHPTLWSSLLWKLCVQRKWMPGNWETAHLWTVSLLWVSHTHRSTLACESWGNLIKLNKLSELMTRFTFPSLCLKWTIKKNVVCFSWCHHQVINPDSLVYNMSPLSIEASVLAHTFRKTSLKWDSQSERRKAHFRTTTLWRWSVRSMNLRYLPSTTVMRPPLCNMNTFYLLPKVPTVPF